MAPDLILGAVDGYDIYEIEPFLISLGQTGYSGQLTLFAGSRTGARTKSKMESFGAEVIEFGDRFPFVADPHPDNVASLPQPIHICNLRYYLYYNYLLNSGSRFRNVLITDVRDVFFQRDPFERGLGQRVHVAMENPGIPIGECRWTAPWVTKAYGKATLERLQSKPMSCSGTTMAPVPLMMRYLQAMLAEIQSMRSSEAYLDQAAHNLLLHDGKLDPVQRINNFDGPILTIGSEPAYRLNSQKELVNGDDSVIALVHQYDRHTELARVVEARVRPSCVRRALSKWRFRFSRKLRGGTVAQDLV